MTEGLIRALADGAVHSKPSLCARLGVSSRRLERDLKALPALGLELVPVDRGVRLAEPLSLLDAATIRRELTPADRASIEELIVLGQTDSTNTELRRREDHSDGALVCLAEYQHAGRGRGRRRWVAPYAGGLCVSLRWGWEQGPRALAGFSLALGVAVARSLAELGFSGIALKWPNDVVARGRKLAGILVESSGDSPCRVVAGIGLNWRLRSVANDAIGQPWIDLATLAPAALPDRNRLAAGLIHHALAAQAEFAAAGLGPFVAEWQDADAFAGREIAIETGGERVIGRALGIAPDGRLLLATAAGERAFAAGEAQTIGR